MSSLDSTEVLEDSEDLPPTQPLDDYISDLGPQVQRPPPGKVVGIGNQTILDGRASEDRQVSCILFNQIYLYAVFDGHGGPNTANLLERHFPEFIYKYLVNVNLDDLAQVQIAIQEAIDQFEQEILISDNVQDGSTLVLSLVTPNFIYFVHLGDSRAVLFSPDGKILGETKDHSSSDLQEQSRVKQAGGSIVFGRVYGNLAVTRALGDLSFKRMNGNYSSRGVVSLEIGISQYPRTSNLYILLASDGLYENTSGKSISNQGIINQIISMKINPIETCVNMVNQGRKHSTDDITCMIVQV